MVKTLPVNAGDARDMGSMPGSGRYPGVRNGNPFQYAWENPRTEETGGYSKPHLSACAHTHMDTHMHTHAHGHTRAHAHTHVHTSHAHTCVHTHTQVSASAFSVSLVFNNCGIQHKPV